MYTTEIHMDGHETVYGVDGLEFERTIAQKLVTDVGCFHLGKGETVFRDYLKNIAITDQARQLANDYNWQEFFRVTDLFAPYLTTKNNYDRIIITQAPYRKLEQVPRKKTTRKSSGRKSRMIDIMLILRDLKKFYLIECKHQDSGGSTEDKIYRTVFDLGQSGTKETLIVIGGDGFTPTVIRGLIDWTQSMNEIVNKGFLNQSKIYLLREKEFSDDFIKGLGDGKRISNGSDILPANAQMAWREKQPA